MKKQGHPEYVECKIACACGNVIETRATKPAIHVEICSACHPFFTGKQRYVDTEGRVERFQKKYASAAETLAKAKADKAAKAEKAAKAKSAKAPAKK